MGMRRLNKRKLACLMGLLLVAAPFPAQAAMETFTTGEDWVKRMTPEQKFMALVMPALLMRHYRVPFEIPAREYVPAIDRVLLNNPYLEKEDVSNIFASTVYLYEPKTRKALEWMMMEMAARKLYFEKGYSPRLLLTRTKEDLSDI